MINCHLSCLADEIMILMAEKQLTLAEMDTVAAELLCRTTKKIMAEKEN